jgi:hypothetical protein
MIFVMELQYLRKCILKKQEVECLLCLLDSSRDQRYDVVT